MTASLVFSGENTDFMEEVEVSLIDTLTGLGVDFSLDSITTSFSKCMDNRLLTVIVDGDGSKYNLIIQSDNVPEDMLSLSGYNDNYYYHPSVGIIQETIMSDSCILSETGSDVRVLRIKEASCQLSGYMDESNNPHFEGTVSLNLNSLSNLIYLIVEDNNQFQNLNTFELSGLQQLEGVKIGRNCFNYEKDTTPKKRYNRKFRITNCPKLTEIQIGNYSFSDFTGEFTLSDLNALTKLTIGEVGKASFNFYRAQSFVVKSTFCFCAIRY